MNLHANSRQHPRRRFSIWVTIVILAMLASSLAALVNPAAAQPTETPTTGEIQAPPADAPVDLPTQPVVAPPDEPTSVPTQDPIVPPLEDPVLEQPDDPASISVSYRVCPAGTDLANTAPATLASVCTGQQNGVPFDLRPASGGIFVWNTGDAGASSVFFADVPTGQATLYGASQGAAIYCEGFTSQGNTRPYAQVDSVAQAQFEGISLDILEGEQITCHWYVPGTETTGDITVIMRKNACPPGYDISTPPDMFDMAATCHDSAGVVTFSVFEAGGGYDGGLKQTSGGQGGVLNSVQFDNVPNVPLWIYEEVPEDYGDPVAFCGVEDFLGNDVAPTEHYPWNAGKIELDAPGEGNVVQCDWYNIPIVDNTVTVYKWDCEPGTEPNRDLNYYQGEGQDEGPCETEHLNVPITLVDANGERPTTTQANGTQWDNVVPDQSGTFQIIEEIPEGYGAPAVFCGTLDQDQQQPVTVTGGTITIQPAAGPFDYQCNWYNIPEGHGTVTIHKWECPEGSTIDPTWDAHQTACTQPMDGIEFNLTDTMGAQPMVTAGGQVQWTDVAPGPVTITETVPPGYHPQPFVVCGWSADNDGSAPTAPPTQVEATNGAHHFSILYPATRYVCDWYNTFAGPGDVTINKWTCPEGYDPFAWSADPKNDCTELTNGVTFILDQPIGADLQTDTGDSINGAVYFGAVHPMPLSVGPMLEMNIAGGDEIVCDWMNVPAYDPDFGWMTVSKKICWTPTYVSNVDCEISEDGATFTLSGWNGTDWTPIVSGTTSVAGQITWTNLMPGSYVIQEENGEPCRIETDTLDAEDHLGVQANAGTSVTVFNCSSTPPVPGGKMPTKYPNTGVEPVGVSDDAPAGSLLAVAGLLGAGSLSRRQFLRRAAAPTIAVGVGSLLVGTGIARQTIAPIELPAGAPATPGADCLFPATPAATPGATPSAASTPVACARGAVPVTITIPVIEVDAGIEVLEIIGGAMQQPTNAEEVAWYKESARLGEQGNVLLAGHLNFWGVPEGVFYLLRQLQEGDAVELEGDDGVTYRYIVQWSEEFPSDEEPPEEALGHTEDQSLTLITCGGEWNAGMAEYDHRTLVRATRQG